MTADHLIGIEQFEADLWKVNELNEEAAELAVRIARNFEELGV